MTKREEIITNFVKTFDEEISVTFLEKSNSFTHGDKVLNINFNELQTEEFQFFIDHLIEKHKFENAKEFNPVTLTILHEMGHYFNKDIVNNWIDMIIISLIEDPRERQYEYFNTKDEWEATEWAINFIKTNYAIVKLFEEKLLTNR